MAWSETDSLGFYESPLLEPGVYVVRVAQHTLPRGLIAGEDDDGEPVHLAPGESYRKDLTLLPQPVRIRLDFEAEEL